MNSDRYHDLADALALAVTDPDYAAAELTASLAGLTGPGWLRLGESARRFNAGVAGVNREHDRTSKMCLRTSSMLDLLHGHG